MKKVKIGVVGCGNISGIYFENLTKVFANTEVFACADLNDERAKNAAEKYEISKIMTLDEILKCNDIEIILNITTPQCHYDICKKALLAGKHVYVEKPLSLSFEQGCELVNLADEKNLMIGGAPDTFLGGGIQTCRKLIDDGYIGDPVAATAFMVCHGHESWHPDPEFYYKKGGGPMFDMGPYYLTALVNLLGSAKTICGMTNISFPQRTITSTPKYGTIIDVEVPTHVAGTIRFNSGVIATVIQSFDVWENSLPRIEIYGTRGTIKVPDPNSFGGPVFVSTLDGSGFKEIPLSHNYFENSRGIGVADMAQCIIDGGKNRANGELTNHVLEIMCGFHQSNDESKYYEMKSECDKPQALPLGVLKGNIK